MDLYQILGVAREATIGEIKSAFRKLAKKHHPDKQGDRDKFEKTRLAYNVLSHPEKRRYYDETGKYQDEVTTVVQVVNSFFERAIDQCGVKTNVLQVVISEIEAKNQTLADEINFSRQLIKKLVTQRPKIVAKKGNNSFHEMIDLKIAKLEASIQEREDAIDFGRMTLEYLADFERLEEPVNN